MARPRKNEETTTPWVVRDVPELTRQQVRAYAAQHKMTMAEAIQHLVARGISGAVPIHDLSTSVVRDLPDSLLAQLARRVREETERRRAMPLEERQAEENERVRDILKAQLESGADLKELRDLISEYMFPSDEPPE